MSGRRAERAGGSSGREAGQPLGRAARSRRLAPLVGLLLLGWFASGCTYDMYDQPRYEPLEASTFFPDGMSARPIVEGTVPRGAAVGEEALAGTVEGEPVREIPMPVTLELLRRGQQRFEIYCAVCHGPRGYGNGMIVQRGFRPPPSFHDERLLEAPAGHYYNVITHGFGVMPSYAKRVAPPDRWAIVAYIRALQLSQNAPLEMVPAERREKLLQIRAEEQP